MIDIECSKQLSRQWNCMIVGLLFCLSLVLCNASALAQTAELSGIVTDNTKAVIPNASVSITNAATNVTARTGSNGSGFFLFPGMPAGTYNLTIQSNGFAQTDVKGIVLSVSSKSSLTVALRPTSTAETVEVQASDAQINTTDASVGTVISQQFVSNLPLNGRSFQSLLTLVPGVSAVKSQGAGVGGDMSVNGQRTEGNYYMVDGVSATTGATPLPGSGSGFGAGYSGTVSSSTALGTTQSLVSIDALDEFKATTSTYSAQYGRTAGGQFSFNTKSGTKALHGSAYEYFRNGALDANNWFNNHTAPVTPRQAENQNDFGSTLGGPVFFPHIYDGRQATFFFISYEGLRLEIPYAAALYNVPSVSLRQAAPAQIQYIMNAWPLPNGSDLGNGLSDFTSGYSGPAHVNTTGVRVDHVVNDHFSVFGRYSDVPSQSSGNDASGLNLAVIKAQTNTNHVVTLGATNVFPRRITNEARFNFTRSTTTLSTTPTSFGGASVPDIAGNTPGWVSGSRLTACLCWGLDPQIYIQPDKVKQDQWNLVDTVFVPIGRHNLAFGVDYRRLINSETRWPLEERTYWYSQAAVISNSTTSYNIRRPLTSTMNPIFLNLSVFAQDEWKISTRLSASIGVRWEYNPPLTDARGNPPAAAVNVDDLATVAAAPKGTPLWNANHDAFGPRVGLAYSAHQTPDHETVIRIGGGVYYDNLNAKASEGYNALGQKSREFFATGTPFPVSKSVVSALPAPSLDSPYTNYLNAFSTNIKLPYTVQWNVGVQQALGTRQSFLINYVGAAARKLPVTRFYYPQDSGNTAFSLGNGLQVTTNAASSDYEALQLQFQRALSKGLQALVSYTWSHAIDNSTSNFLVYTLQRANADNDARHNFQAAATYDVPGLRGSELAAKLSRHWSLDLRESIVSAYPVDIQSGYATDSQGDYLVYHPNRVAGTALYLSVAGAPGNRVINFNGFVAAKNGSTLIEGNGGRNSARGFASSQTDLTARREIPIHDNLGIQLRVEAFNILNQATFGDIYNQLTSGSTLFGYAKNTLNNRLGSLNPLYQLGGPRSLQLAVKVHF
jgi:hypothetical protein